MSFSIYEDRQVLGELAKTEDYALIEATKYSRDETIRTILMSSQLNMKEKIERIRMLKKAGLVTKSLVNRVDLASDRLRYLNKTEFVEPEFSRWDAW